MMIRQIMLQCIHGNKEDSLLNEEDVSGHVASLLEAQLHVIFRIKYQFEFFGG